MEETTMKKSLRLSSICLSVIAASLLATPGFAHVHKAEHHNYKGERMEAPCPPPCGMLHDGFYVGGQVGYDSYRIHESFSAGGPFVVAAEDMFPAVSGSASFFAERTLNGTGVMGGLFAGWGMTFANAWYLGAEIFANDSAAKSTTRVDADVTVFPFVADAELETTVQADWSYGITINPGYRINCGTVGYIKLGWQAHRLKTSSDLDVGAFDASTGEVFADLDAHHNDSHWYNGFAYGLGMETVVWENWSVRGEYTHVDLGHHHIHHSGVKLSPSDNQYTLGLVYHFC